MRSRTIQEAGDREYRKALRAGLSTECAEACRAFGIREAWAKGQTRMFAPLCWTAKKVAQLR